MPADDTQLLRVIQGKATAERDVESRRALHQCAARGRTPSAPESTPTAAGEAAYDKAAMPRPLIEERTRPRSYPRSRKRPVASYPSHRVGDRRPATLTQDPLQDRVDRASLIFDFRHWCTTSRWRAGLDTSRGTA